MEWGLQNRLARFVKPNTGHTVMLAADHGYFMGPTRRLENPRATLEPLLPFADAIAVTRGVLRSSVPAIADVPIVLRVSGGVTVLKDDLSDEAITTSMEEALRLNASAVALSVFVGAAHEHQSLVSLAELVDEGEAFGMPVIAITAVGKELEKRDARYLSLACRVSAELGAHLVKTYYCEEFERVVEGCPVPLVVAGGPKLDTDKAVLELCAGAIAKGAVGVDMGRNIWQSDYPVPMIKAIRAIVHEKATAREALQLLEADKKLTSRVVRSVPA
ncbi:MAG: 3-hydroxy-5-phosphonooxypentane-2,4-dione thiolase [Thermoplasmata archaeon]|nr:3-hydroxy-5-phosphonooxypentane-2,4-dione thiolase [Thermoplasmata archaeon]